MSKKLKVVAVSGSDRRPSRTLTVIDEITQRLGKQLSIDLHLIELGQISKELGITLSRQELSPTLEKEIAAIENADLLVVATPVYRGSYTGLFKHLFDLVNHEALIDVPVLLAATGGSERHSLVIDHQLRPLFSFFQSLTLPIGVYGTEADFENYQITNKTLDERINLAVERALPFIHHRKSEGSSAAIKLASAY